MDRDYARRQMVRQQVRAWDVFDEETLDLLNNLQRHEFVPQGFADLAYADTQIPLPAGQVMMTPTVEGKLLQAVDPQPDDRVLDVGAGSGFLAACLASLAHSVLSVDIHSELVKLARRNLDKAGIDNVEVLEMDITAELPDGDFDVIAVSGSMAEFDERLVDKLRPDGRLFVIVGDAPVMEAWLVTRAGDGWSRDVLFETCIKPLVNAERKSAFSF